MADEGKNHVAVDDESPVNTTDDQESPFDWDIDIWFNLIACWAALFTSIWTLVVGSGIIGFITTSFPEDAGISIWIASSVTIANCVIQAFLGDLSDHFGRKWPLLFGMAMIFAGSLIASRASSMGMVIAGQSLNGVGLTCGFLAIPMSAEIVPKDQRGPILAASGLVSGVGYIIAPIVAGVFIKHNVGGQGDGWRVAFYLEVGLAFLSFVIILFCYHPAKRPNPDNLSFMTRLFRIDWTGVFLVTAGLTLFLVGLESGDNPTPWISGRVLACMAVGGVLIISFGFWEWLGTKNGIVAHSLFGNVNYPICLALNFVDGIVLFGGQAFLPQEIINLFTRDAIMTGVYNIPFNAMTIGGGVIAAIVLGIMKEAKWCVVVSFVVLLVGNCIMLVMHKGINFAAWFFPTAMLGAAVGIQNALLTVVVSICTPNHLIASGVSVTASCRALGGSIGTVIFSQIFAAKLKHFLPEDVGKAVAEAGLPVSAIPESLQALLGGNQDALSHIPGVTEDVLAAAQEARAHAYAHGFKFVWYSLIPFAVVATGLSMFLQTTKPFLTRQVAAPVERRHRHR
ncbi:hypothetical protein ASPVEDRAFT_155531 [Aspergillus versicolor CBS 583.65]|uniref:Major facilitator superfamily (MFS) profile domain-containing protein n=1 Tax=Aspergillus versicolor CBS 583.65 TaxID=1036611 RepID=A0A1L9Q1Y8_ASPVE|nr:uncharacterized protein ASPVEDRAFT_155531 [Aspergillus versicolor CBS 583.65]OJJ07749.1 hypothetical protein ASPVEDRAFT_155531 [Aspergillus versicolor CBS 583.65]